MDNLHFTFAVFALLFTALAAIAIWSRRKAPWKIAALGLVALILPLGYFAYIDLLAKPKPMRLEFRQLGETEVISAVLKGEEEIYCGSAWRMNRAFTNCRGTAPRRSSCKRSREAQRHGRRHAIAGIGGRRVRGR